MYTSVFMHYIVMHCHQEVPSALRRPPYAVGNIGDGAVAFMPWLASFLGLLDPLLTIILGQFLHNPVGEPTTSITSVSPGPSAVWRLWRSAAANAPQPVTRRKPGKLSEVALFGKL